MTKVPTRSPTHEDIELSRLASLGLEVEEVADNGEVAIPALVELAEDRGRPVSHYLAAVPLATDVMDAGGAPIVVRVCAGNCQRWGALDLLDHLVARWQATNGAAFSIMPIACLDRCDHAPACEVHSDDGQLVLAPATEAALDEALDALG